MAIVFVQWVGEQLFISVVNLVCFRMNYMICKMYFFVLDLHFPDIVVSLEEVVEYQTKLVIWSKMEMSTKCLGLLLISQKSHRNLWHPNFFCTLVTYKQSVACNNSWPMTSFFIWYFTNSYKRHYFCFFGRRILLKFKFHQFCYSKEISLTDIQVVQQSLQYNIIYYTFYYNNMKH